VQEVVLKDATEDERIRIKHPRPLSGQGRFCHCHRLRWRYKGRVERPKPSKPYIVVRVLSNPYCAMMSTWTQVRRTTGNWKDVTVSRSHSDDLSSESPSATFVMRLRFVAIAGHMLPVGLVCSHRHCERPVAWIVLSYCGSYSLPLHRPGFNDSRDEINKVGQSNYHGDPAASLLELLDQNKRRI
jgi:hypothetical protein